MPKSIDGEYRAKDSDDALPMQTIRHQGNARRPATKSGTAKSGTLAHFFCSVDVRLQCAVASLKYYANASSSVFQLYAINWIQTFCSQGGYIFCVIIKNSHMQSTKLNKHVATSLALTITRTKRSKYG